MVKQKRKTHFTNPYRLGKLPATNSSFEEVVQNLCLLPYQYSESAELKAWVRRYKKYKYVPPDVLEIFGFDPGPEV